MSARLVVTPRQYTRVAWLALAALTLIVLSGAAVRLTDSGLGCPTWPRCYGHIYPPVAIHPLIEFGNRAVAGLVGVIAAAAAVLAFRRRPFRRDLAVLALLLPLGVIAQAVLGGYTVREKLAPGFVMSHFLLSMAVLIPAFALVWRSLHEPGSRPRSSDRPLVWTVRALAPLAALTILAGTAATAAGPHSGGLVGQHVVRLTIKGPDTLEWAVHQHAVIAVIFGLAVILAWLLKRRGSAGPLDPLEPLTVLGLLLAAQGLVGSVQYELKLPAEMVWVHVGLATITWLVTLWAVASEGRLAPRSAPAGAGDDMAGAAAGRALETVGR